MGERKRKREAAPLGDMESFRFEQGPCLNCGAPLTGLTGPKGRPDKGSIMVCAGCLYAMEWDGAGLGELSAETMAELEQDPDLTKAIAITKAVRETGLPLSRTRIILIEAREPEVCQECGQLNELRPYGRKQPDGKRKWVCFPCAQKNEAELQQAFEERIEGTNPV